MENDAFKFKVSALIADLQKTKASKTLLERKYLQGVPDDVKTKITELEERIKKIETQLSFLQ